MKNLLKTLVILGLIFALAPFLPAQRLTGDIKGYVVDNEGVPLPGAEVTIAGPKLLGKMTQVTTQQGMFIARNLTPGEYSAEAKLTGFEIVKETGLIVHAGMTITIKITLTMSTISKEVEVVAPSPVVDFESAKAVERLDSNKLENIPLTRDLSSIVAMVSGAVAESTAWDTTSIKGSTVRANVYGVDGVVINDPTTGYRLTKVNFDDIEEAEIITGGKPAEIGAGSGGYVNIVTKTGGDRYTGGLVVQYTGEDFKKNLPSDDTIEALGASPQTYDKYNLDMSVNFGGPIIKDKLTGFISARRFNLKRLGGFTPFTDPLGVYHDEYAYTHQDRYAGIKLNYQIMPNLKLTESFNFTQDEAPVYSSPYWTTPKESTWRTDADKAFTQSAILNWVINNNTFLEVKLPFQYRGTGYLLQKEAEEKPYFRDSATSYRWGSMNYNLSWTRASFHPSVNLTKFYDDLLGGSHEFKIGLEYENAIRKNDWWKADPINWTYYDGDPHSQANSNPILGRFSAYITGPNKGDNIQKDAVWRIAAFARDNFSIGKRLSFNVGLRYDESHAFKPNQVKKGITAQLPIECPGLLNTILPDLFSPDDIVVDELKDLIVWKDISPRIGVIYDLFGTGKTALKASFSRYTEYLLVEFTSYSNPFPIQSASFYWYDDNADGLLDLPPTDTYVIISQPTVEPDTEAYRRKIDSNLKAPYTDEYIIGIQHEITKDFRIGLDYTYKNAKRFCEDVDIENPLTSDRWIPYTVTDPGWDRQLGTEDDQSLTVYWLKQGVLPYKQLQNVPQAKRKYQALTLTFDKRMSNGWQLGGSVVYSKIYGNYFGGGSSPLGYMSYYDNPNSLVNTENSRLDFDRPLVIKIFGTVRLPWDFYISGYYSHYDGSPRSRNVMVYFPSTIDGFSPYYTNSGTVKADPHGGSRRYEGTDNLDLRIEKELDLRKIGLYGTFKASVDIFNVLGNIETSISNTPFIYIYADGSVGVSSSYGRVYGIYGTRSFLFNLRYSF
jgi:hypothetical protein